MSIFKIHIVAGVMLHNTPTWAEDRASGDVGDEKVGGDTSTPTTEANPATEPTEDTTAKAEQPIDKSDEETEAKSGKKKGILAGLLVCVLAGVLSSGLNIAFHVVPMMCFGGIFGFCYQN